MSCTVAIIGTDTGVGKTTVTLLLARGLRALGHRVWLHKPIACGGWDGKSAEDARALELARSDDQPPATLCPLQFSEAAAPHVAARAAGRDIALAELIGNLDLCCGTHDLLIEGVGGLLVPLTATRESIAGLLRPKGIPIIIVTRPDLGTLNHSALTVSCARSLGLTVLGFVLNHHRHVAESLATRCVAEELTAITGVPILATIPFGTHHNEELARILAGKVLVSEQLARL